MQRFKHLIYQVIKLLSCTQSLLIANNREISMTICTGMQYTYSVTSLAWETTCVCNKLLYIKCNTVLKQYETKARKLRDAV